MNLQDILLSNNKYKTHKNGWMGTQNTQINFYVFPEFSKQHRILYNFWRTLLRSTSSNSLTSILPPVPHAPFFLYFQLFPAVYISNRVELFQCISLQSQAGDGHAPPIPPCQTMKADSCFENFPIMQTDKGILFKSPQPICWSLFIYKDLQAASPIKN